MSIVWLVPAALAGAGLAVVPIVIHLLARYRSRHVLFPTLRFLPASQLAALRRRAIADWPLLVIRVLIVLAAVAAAAAPVFVSDARRAEWDRRTARAIVTVGGDGVVSRLAAEEADSAFASARFSEPRLPDAIRAAAGWLRDQAPAARELVLVGDLRDGEITSRDFAVLGPHVGVRFLPVPVPVPDDAPGSFAAVADMAGEVASLEIRVTPMVDQTRVQYVVAQGDPLDERVRVHAAAQDQPYADAILRAVQREGLILDDSDRAIRLLFDGTRGVNVPDEAPTAQWMREVLERNPEVRGGSDGPRTLVVRATVRATDPAAPEIAAGVLRSAFTPSFAPLEPRRVTAATLAEWSRPAGTSPGDALPADEGDGRFLWAFVLLLLAFEHVVRRRRRYA